MPFAKTKRKGARIVSSRLHNDRVKKVYKSAPHQPSTNNDITISQPSSSSKNIFDAELHNACEFLISGEAVVKTGLYEKTKEKEIEEWKLKTEDTILAYGNKYHLMISSKCVKCGVDFSNTAYVWCQSCGPDVTYCSSCCKEFHSSIPFHCMKEITNHFEVKEYKYSRTLCSKHVQMCSSRYTRNMTIIGESGYLHECCVYFCSCDEELNSLVQYNVWPATPTKPLTAVSMELLFTFIALQLEGKISLLSFCDALSWKSGILDHQLRKCLYRFLKTDAIDQFRQFRYGLLNLKTVSPNYSGFRKCAACPKKNGSLFYCMDANFGLVLKKSSSKSKKMPIRSEQLFVADTEVVNFMEKYDDSSGETKKDCSNFQAGNNIRSKRKTNKLSVTGVFGMSCRHEYPKLFLNMCHGERLGYAVMLLDKILQESNGKELDVHIVYDIACVLKRHLEKKQTMTKYKHFNFGIPLFHSYGHNGNCQIKNSIRRLESFGLMDGELMERLWSYWRSFSKITKEMTPAHRMDLLGDALMHFGSIKMGNIGNTLVNLYEKANKTMKSCCDELDAICSKLQVSITADVLNAWKSEEDEAVTKQPSNAKDIEWTQCYYRKLKEFWKEKRLSLMSEKLSDRACHISKAARIDITLKSLEKKHTILARWTVSTPEYRFQHKNALQFSQDEAICQLYHEVSERMMLLVLKKRYGDGSAIANRLSAQINKVCREIKNQLDGLNDIRKELNESYSNLKYSEILDVNSAVYQKNVNNSRKCEEKLRPIIFETATSV